MLQIQKLWHAGLLMTCNNRTMCRSHSHTPASSPLPPAAQVLEAEYDAQKNIAPFLENRVLRRIVQARLQHCNRSSSPRSSA